MSSAKRAIRQAVLAWLRGESPPPRVWRRCDACGDEAWRPLDRRARRAEVNAWLPDGRRADLALLDRGGKVVLVVQLADGSRLRDRSQTAAGAPLVVLDGKAVMEDPLHWRPLRERGLRAWRCRCAQAQALPVDDGFSLRVIGCPLNLRRMEAVGPGAAAPAESYASVIHDCGRCGFFVGIGYSDVERRRVSLYCSFEQARHRRLSLLPPAPPKRAPASAAPASAPPRERSSVVQ